MARAMGRRSERPSPGRGGRRASTSALRDQREVRSYAPAGAGRLRTASQRSRAGLSAGAPTGLTDESLPVARTGSPRNAAARNPRGVVAENLLGGAAIHCGKSADLGAERIHPRAIEWPSGPLELVFESGDHGVAEGNADPLADLLNRITGAAMSDAHSPLSFE